MLQVYFCRIISENNARSTLAAQNRMTYFVSPVARISCCGSAAVWPSLQGKVFALRVPDSLQEAPFRLLHTKCACRKCCFTPFSNFPISSTPCRRGHLSTMLILYETIATLGRTFAHVKHFRVYLDIVQLNLSSH